MIEALLEVDCGIHTSGYQGFGRTRPPAEVPPRPRRPGILLVDPEAMTCFLLAARLREEGLAVWLARDGVAALELYLRHAGSIDLVVLDARLPGLDGPQTLTGLRRLDPSVRCCFMNGRGSGYTEEELLELGAVDVFPKPLDQIKGATFLRQLLEHAPTGSTKRSGSLAVPVHWLGGWDEFFPPKYSADPENFNSEVLDDSTMASSSSGARFQLGELGSSRLAASPIPRHGGQGTWLLPTPASTGLCVSRTTTLGDHLNRPS